jgi:hypothetical protein
MKQSKEAISSVRKIPSHLLHWQMRQDWEEERCEADK